MCTQGLGAFYVSFVLAPFVTNAPELVAAYHHSSKKTSGSIAISLATLQGSVCMNNTFALGMFMIVIYWKQLVWEYLAETLTILIVEVFCPCFLICSIYNMVPAVTPC
jgi:Ca2+/Na+ antiporter